jgi:hypothetical protein
LNELKDKLELIKTSEIAIALMEKEKQEILDLLNSSKEKILAAH